MLNSCKYSGNFTNILLKDQNISNWMHEVKNANHSLIFVDFKIWCFYTLFHFLSILILLSITLYESS